MNLNRTIAIAMGAIAAASLGGCAIAPPLSVEESLWFDKAAGTDVTGVPPGLRMQAYYGPPPVHRIYRAPPPPFPPQDEP
ncbi:MAG: hypothetical protein NTV56_08695 [Alphaproteobacteria bacterium]|nr:hypothetical protein [Alphaproteobacteria bacterium]